MKKRFPTNRSSVFSAKPKLGYPPVNSAAKPFPMPRFTPRKKYGGMEVPEVKRLKSLEEENARLKKLLAEAMLDKEALQVALGRKY
jgi:putative transposase